SAAEVYRDLLAAAAPSGTRVDWVTRSERFFPMEYTKLTLEMTSPEYTDLHRALPEEVRDHLSRQQRVLHKGISADLIDEIHELLYGLTAGGRELPSRLLTATAVTGARTDGDEIVLDLAHSLTGETAEHRTGAVIAATGYRPRDADLLAPLGDRVRRDASGRLDVARDYTVDEPGRLHVLGTEEHTHGVTARTSASAPGAPPWCSPPCWAASPTRSSERSPSRPSVCRPRTDRRPPTDQERLDGPDLHPAGPRRPRRAAARLAHHRPRPLLGHDRAQSRSGARLPRQRRRLRP